MMHLEKFTHVRIRMTIGKLFASGELLKTRAYPFHTVKLQLLTPLKMELLPL